MTTNQPLPSDHFLDAAMRIKEHLEHARGNALEREVIVAWHGYIFALTEWNLISISEMDRLRAMLPGDTPEAVIQIALGIDEESSDQE